MDGVYSGGPDGEDEDDGKYAKPCALALVAAIKILAKGSNVSQEGGAMMSSPNRSCAFRLYVALSASCGRNSRPDEEKRRRAQVERLLEVREDRSFRC